MFASRLAITLFALLVSILAALAAPLEEVAAEAAPAVEQQLEKRITHDGQVGYYACVQLVSWFSHLLFEGNVFLCWSGQLWQLERGYRQDHRHLQGPLR